MTETIYQMYDLKSAISTEIERRNLTFRRVCEATRIHPSYFSRVMKDEASLSQSQVFSIAQYFALSAEATDFLILLWQVREASHRDEKNFFAKKVREIREVKLKVSKDLSVPVLTVEEKKSQFDTYYAEAVTAQIHMALTIPEYRRNLQKLASSFAISETKLKSELSKLSKLGLIKTSGNQIQLLQDSVHLDEDSSAGVQATNHINWRLKTINCLDRREPQADDYHLSVVFSADEETKSKLKKLLREFIVQAQKTVVACKEPTQVYHMMADLF